MKIAVVGSRSLKDYSIVEDTLFSIFKPVEDTLISGGANGADILAEQFADENNIDKIIYKPDWDKYGKAAGFIRNQLIIDDADYVVAFWDGKSKGTMDTINKARKKNLELMIIEYVED